MFKFVVSFSAAGSGSGSTTLEMGGHTREMGGYGERWVAIQKRWMAM